MKVYDLLRFNCGFCMYTYSTCPSSNYQFRRRCNASQYLSIILYRTFANKNSLVAFIISNTQRMIGEAPSHILVVVGRNKNFILFNSQYSLVDVQYLTYWTFHF